jgi:predicted AlkP superfamily pyrophosphatase or phosphodiesterase
MQTPLSLLRSFIIVIFLLSIFLSPFQVQGSDIKNPVILISLDGFRYDYIEKYNTKHLKALARDGVRAEKMQPSYPSKTFPNHITLVTGKYPSNHGLVHNRFYDEQLDDVYSMGKAKQQPLWLWGKPLWILAEQNNVRSATYFWPESDSKIEGILPSYYYPYNKSTPYQDRIDEIMRWLKLPENQRPRFITGYFSLVDSIGHEFGPDSQEVRVAVNKLDGYIGQLKQRISTELSFPVNLVIVSDHGMVAINKKSKIDWAQLNKFSNYKVVNGSTQLMLYANKGVNNNTIVYDAKLLAKQSQGRYLIYTKENIPARLHYSGNYRIADIVAEAIPPATFSDKEHLGKKIGGTHGFNPYLVEEMGALFIANGPDFKKGLVISPFENIHVFPILATILDLPIPNDIDGKLSVLKPILISDSLIHPNEQSNGHIPKKED